MRTLSLFCLTAFFLFSGFCGISSAALEAGGVQLDLTGHMVGFISLIIFLLAYAVVMVEEVTHLRKSKPVLLAAGLIWGLIGFVYASNGIDHVAEAAIRHNILEYAELLLFLLVAMTFINAMDERLVFEVLRVRLVGAGYSFRKLFWITGALAFFISPVADNLTTALLMCAVVMAIGKEDNRFVCLSCINIVVAANAGGAFSPFGDITTLMVWQKGLVQFHEFLTLFLPSAVNWLVPAIIMSFAVPPKYPKATVENLHLKRGALVIIGLFLWTIITAVSFHNFLQLPPMVGMMAGLSLLKLYGYYLNRTHNHNGPSAFGEEEQIGDVVPFDIFRKVARAEWDTLLFFYGVILCVGGLGFMGYLAMASQIMYLDWGPTTANIAVGLLSAVVDNIPVMFAVLTMLPDMSQGQWLLVALTAGTGGSLLSIGSAAGVALMGQARGKYTFFSHLKWSPVIALGYAAAIYVHFLVNSSLFRIG
ncbi:sodium:proton antiporter NhaD [Desulfosediminicola flagellatus]|uniref:sodium:proton antiporter NhaD n=1 Tax=Desulfosediminicola flagellatus TaxID=2569541 RepID=UPI0010AD6A75|nr:sodium:proton antiporter NhaD [Desulfosediminicola flagellatus]